MTAELTELRLNGFKSIKDARIPLGPVTLIVGRNGSGKSNVIDGLAVLGALATGSPLRDALDGGREGPVVRGGSQGCAPIGTTQFSVGCDARADGVTYHLDLTLSTAPSLQIVSERLWSRRPSGPKRGEPRDHLVSDPPLPYSADITARWDNGKRGINPPVTMRADQLLTAQVATRVPATSAAGRTVHDIATTMLDAISGIFILDPVPHQMREYVSEKDDRLRRNADNLSAALLRLTHEPSVRRTLLDMTRSLSEAQVSDMRPITSEIGDVMISIDEMIDGKQQPIPARLMSDGTLRFLAIAAAMLDSPASGSDAVGRLLVVEEIENGLHPSQAAHLLGRLTSAAEERRTRTIATTHSPAILDALTGADHQNVFVASRAPDGWSAVTRLTDFPDYFETVGKTSLGAAAVHDDLRPRDTDSRHRHDTLAEIFGA